MSQDNSIVLTFNASSATSIASQIETDGLFSLRESLINQGFSPASVNIIMSSWRTSPRKQYATYIKRWFTYCTTYQYNPCNPPTNIAVQFLTSLYDHGLSYSCINTAGSALSSIFQLKNRDMSFGNLPVVRHFMRGILQLCPALPKYNAVWNVHTVFDFIRSCPTIAQLNLKELTLHLTFLLCLLSAQRWQTIKALRIDNMDITPSTYIFPIVDMLKQSRPGFHQEPIRYERYIADPRLCVYTHLTTYIEQTKSIRGGISQLLISHSRPHHAASSKTISRWCKQFLALARIDTTRYKGHSTRSASTSLLVQSNNADLSHILKAAGWSNDHTFRRFYNLPQEQTFNVGTGLIDSDI